MENTQKSLGIIGYGLSGMHTARYALERGLQIKILEKESCSGGVWGENGCAWPSVVSNIAHKLVDSEHYTWGDGEATFPTSSAIGESIQNYATKFDLNKYVVFSSEVFSVKQIEGKSKVEISYRNIINSSIEIYICDYLIIATGTYSSPHMILDNVFKENCQIEIKHSKHYKFCEDYKGKRVIVIGNSHSGCQITSEVSRVAEHTVNLFRKPSFILKRLCEVKDKLVPITYFYFGNRGNRIKNSKIARETIIKQTKNRLLSIFKQNEYHQELYIDPDSSEEHHIATDDFYLELAKEGKFIPKKGIVEKIICKDVYLESGEILKDIDSIILATGFSPDLSFLSEELKRIYIPEKDEREGYSSNMCLDYLQIANTQVSNISFVGTHYWSGGLSLELETLVCLEYLINGGKRIRENIEKYDSDDLVSYQECLADELGLLPRTQDNLDEELMQWINQGPITYHHYLINSIRDLRSDTYLKIKEELKIINEIVK